MVLLHYDAIAPEPFWQGEGTSRNFRPQRHARNRPLLRAAFKSYITAVSILPLPLRRLFETHTVFVCCRLR